MSGGLGGFLSGMAAGYGTVMNFKRDKEDDDFRREQRENARKDRADADSLKTDLKRAGETVGVQETAEKQDFQDNRDVGQPGEVAPTPTGFAVNGVKFADRAAADAEAAKQNSSAARTARVAGVLDAHGKVNESMQLRQGQQQMDIGGLQLDEAQRKHINQMWDDNLAPLASHEDIVTFVGKARGDGHGGELQVQAVPSADGKKVAYQKLNPDGSTTPTGMEFDNNARGIEQAKLWLSKNTPMHDKLTNSHQLAMERLQGEQQAATAKNQAGMLGVAQQNANTQEQWRRDQAGHLTRMEGIARDKGDANSKMSPDDAAAYKSLDSERQNLTGLINKAKAEGMWTGSPEQKQLETQLASIAIRQRDLLGQYGNQGRQPDPLGLRAPAATAGVQPPAQAAPAAPAAVVRVPAAAQGIPAAAVPAAARAEPDYKARIAELEQQLATDDGIKKGGLSGMGRRAIEARALPMGMGSRADAERELADLKKKAGAKR